MLEAKNQILLVVFFKPWCWNAKDTENHDFEKETICYFLNYGLDGNQVLGNAMPNTPSMKNVLRSCPLLQGKHCIGLILL